MPPLLIAHRLHKSYIAGYGQCWARVHVLTSLSLSLTPGERVLILGTRASGKSTLLHCLVGLRRPNAGVVRWNAALGAPYRVCRDPGDVSDAAHHRAALVELPEHARALTPWIDALLACAAAGAGWLVLATAAPALERNADRVLRLRDGVLHAAPGQGQLLRVAEPGGATAGAGCARPVTTRIPG